MHKSVQKGIILYELEHYVFISQNKYVEYLSTKDFTLMIEKCSYVL